jgi:hypothetical protein
MRLLSNESELIDSKLAIHGLTEHANLQAELRALHESYLAQLEELNARVESHLSSYHAPESEEQREEEHEEEREEEKEEEEEEEEEEAMADDEKKEPSEPKPKRVVDKPPKTDHFLLRRFSFGGKKK